MRFDFRRIPLLAWVLMSIALGIVLGWIMPLPAVKVFATFNAIFGQYLGFIVPLIIVGLVTPAIADLGKSAGWLLLLTLGIAFADTVFVGCMAYGVGSLSFPAIVQSASTDTATTITNIEPYFLIKIPSLFDVMSALILAFLVGIGIVYTNAVQLKKVCSEFGVIIGKTIQRTVVPLLPIYIFGIFLQMSFTGDVGRILSAFAVVIIIIFALHLFILLYEFVIAGAVVRRNPFRLLWNMLPAYATALGTASSVATIPVTVKQAKRNGVSDDVVNFSIPLCATTHMSGSMMKITCCALTICLLQNIPYSFGMFAEFILLLSVVMVAAPGVPGGAIMAALGPLATVLGFGPDEQALIIALYIAMDSFGTACNVTGDGAIALIVDKIAQKSAAKQVLAENNDK